MLQQSSENIVYFIYLFDILKYNVETQCSNLA